MVVHSRHAGLVQSFNFINGAVSVLLKLDDQQLLLLSMHAPHRWCGACSVAVASFDDYLDSVSKLVESMSVAPNTKSSLELMLIVIPLLILEWLFVTMHFHLGF